MEPVLWLTILTLFQISLHTTIQHLESTLASLKTPCHVARGIAAIAAARDWTQDARTIYLSPQGRVLDHGAVANLAGAQRDLILVAGRYEGIDERVVELEIDEEWSIGDYVLSGGELPAMVLLDALIRQLPGALGDADSARQDSFAAGLLEWPHGARIGQDDVLSKPPGAGTVGSAGWCGNRTKNTISGYPAN